MVLAAEHLLHPAAREQLDAAHALEDAREPGVVVVLHSFPVHGVGGLRNRQFVEVIAEAAAGPYGYSVS